MNLPLDRVPFDYRILTSPEIPPWPSGIIKQYLLARDGLLVRAARPGLDVLVPYLKADLPGLARIRPFVRLAYPPIPQIYVEAMLEQAQRFAQQTPPLEVLFYLWWEDGWHLDMPAQRQSLDSVATLDERGHIQALVEIHSHHRWEPRFSRRDNRSETYLRLYGVLGDVLERPTLRMRAGVPGGLTGEFPARLVAELPPSLIDAVAEEEPSRISPDKGYPNA